MTEREKLAAVLAREDRMCSTDDIEHLTSAILASDWLLEYRAEGWVDGMRSASRVVRDVAIDMEAINSSAAALMRKAARSIESCLPAPPASAEGAG